MDFSNNSRSFADIFRDIYDHFLDICEISQDANNMVVSI